MALVRMLLAGPHHTHAVRESLDGAHQVRLREIAHDGLTIGDVLHACERRVEERGQPVCLGGLGDRIDDLVEMEIHEAGRARRRLIHACPGISIENAEAGFGNGIHARRHLVVRVRIAPATSHGAPTLPGSGTQASLTSRAVCQTGRTGGMPSPWATMVAAIG